MEIQRFFGLLLFLFRSCHAFQPISFLASFLSASVESQSTIPTDGNLSQQEADVRKIQLEQERIARGNHNNDVWNALFVSVPERKTPTKISEGSVTGKRPNDIPGGALLRIGPMGADQDEGFLDGDGFIHCITIPLDKSAPVVYSSAYIDTEGRQLERARSDGKKIKGTLGGAPRGFPLLATVVKNMINFQVGTKDTCNTAIAESGGRLLGLMEQSPPSEFTISKNGAIQTVHPKTNLDGAIKVTDPLTGGSLSAHGRTCPDTKERIHVSYASSAPPFARVDIFEEGWKLKRSVGVKDLKVPLMIHDCSISENYVLILDFPLTLRPARMIRDKFPVEYEPENGARIGLLRRRGGEDDSIQWFDCKPGVILHTANAYETDDNKLVLHAIRSEPNGVKSFISSYAASFLYEWVLDLETGKVVSEGCLNAEELVDFPVIDDRFHSKQADSVYSLGVYSIGSPLRVYASPQEGIVLDSIVKQSLVDVPEKGIKKGDVTGRFTAPDGYYVVTEPSLVPKEGDSSGVYMVVVATQVPEPVPSWDDIAEKNVLKSRVFVLDGEDMNAGPVWEFDLPYHVGYGLHSAFVEWDKLI